ncbi:DoxX family protein [Dasania marina]|uniref:HvfX family Cu-binding RiPP maturation protein n=1 Tax=Dasania marina TaxID=471499 RepID=UPI0003765B20|nr:DoxX family protein [Dasania marina]
MSKLSNTYYCMQAQLLDRTACLSGLAPLLLRLYLIPVFWMAGSSKIDFTTLMPYAGTVQWFGDYLGMPLPTLMAFLAGWAEVLGAVFLAAGFAVRWISIPLMVTMLVAAFAVHWPNGWQAIADASAPFANERVAEATMRLERAKEILTEHGNYAWLTGRGSLVIVNNGIEFSITYFVMLLSLFFSGGGRYVSLDYWLSRAFPKP